MNDIAAMCHAVAISLMMANRNRAHVLIFNFSGIVCEAFLYSTAYRLAKPTGAIGASTPLLPAAIMALTSFSFSSLLAATAASWTDSKLSWQLWAKPLPAKAGRFCCGLKVRLRLKPPQVSPA